MDSKIKKFGKQALGRGLSALISTPVPVQQEPHSIGNVALNTEQNQQVISAPEPGLVQYLDIDRIVNNPAQPRQEFKEGEILELSLSIKQMGVLQPILVKRAIKESGSYEIIAGERRWRAAKLAGLNSVPAIIKDISDQEVLEISIIENVQREDLNPVEAALAYQRLCDEFNLSHDEVAQKVGKDRTSISNCIRLLKLPKEVVQMVKEGKLTVGHAKAILAIKDPAGQLSLAKKTVAEELSVRALENIISQVVVLDAGKASSKLRRVSGSENQEESNTYPEATERLRRALGTKIKIKEIVAGKGKIEIEYFSEQELDRIIDKICNV